VAVPLFVRATEPVFVLGVGTTFKKQHQDSNQQRGQATHGEISGFGGFPTVRQQQVTSFINEGTR